MSEPTPDAVRDIAEVAAIEVITTAAVHLMSAAAVKCGLSPDTAEVKGTDLIDLDEARKLITALAGLITAAAPEVGNQHARSLRDGLRSLQLAFREASPFPDPPGEGPGEKFTGSVVCSDSRSPRAAPGRPVSWEHGRVDRTVARGPSERGRDRALGRARRGYRADRVHRAQHGARRTGAP